VKVLKTFLNIKLPISQIQYFLRSFSASPVPEQSFQHYNPTQYWPKKVLSMT